MTTQRQSRSSAEASSTPRSRTVACGCTSTKAPRCWPCCGTPLGQPTPWFSRASRGSSNAQPHVVETPPEAHAHAEQLSHRELEVLRLLDSELTGPEIARQLYVTVNTLRTHTKRIFTKLNVTTRAAAVRQAHQQGLL